jgi:hypothetical protein
MLFATSIGIFFIPLFFRVIRGLAEGRGRPMQQPRHGVIAPSLPEREPAVRI